MLTLKKPGSDAFMKAMFLTSDKGQSPSGTPHNLNAQQLNLQRTNPLPDRRVGIHIFSRQRSPAHLLLRAYCSVRIITARLSHFATSAQHLHTANNPTRVDITRWMYDACPKQVDGQEAWTRYDLVTPWSHILRGYQKTTNTTPQAFLGTCSIFFFTSHHSSPCLQSSILCRSYPT